MENIDFHKLAVELVEPLHIFDQEWKEILIEEYEEMLKQAV